MRKIEIPGNPSVELAIIKNDYIALHRASGHIDLSMATDYFVQKQPVKAIAVKYSFSEQTVYNRLCHVRNIVETQAVYRWMTLPKGLLIDIASINPHSYKLALMSFAKYLYNGETAMKRADIVARFPYLEHRNTMCRMVKELQNAMASYEPSNKDLLIHLAPGLKEKIKIYQSVEYTRGVLLYTFTDVMEQVLWISRMIAYADTHQLSEE